MEARCHLLRTPTTGGTRKSHLHTLPSNCWCLYLLGILLHLTTLTTLRINTFVPNSCQFGFFLNETLFHTSAALPLPLGHHHRPTAALLTTVYLVGIHLSTTEALRTHEAIFLTRALRFTSNALSGSHPHKIIHALQAEILLANYFFRTGRLLEGKYHCSAAASLAISCELDKIRSSRSSFSPPESACVPKPFNLAPPQDTIEEGERIHAFWAIFILDKCWSVALGSPSHFTDSEALGTRIDTPWPLTNMEYEQVWMFVKQFS